MSTRIRHRGRAQAFVGMVTAIALIAPMIGAAASSTTATSTGSGMASTTATSTTNGTTGTMSTTTASTTMSGSAGVGTTSSTTNSNNTTSTSTGTSTATTTNGHLQDRIRALEVLVAWLQREVSYLLQVVGAGGSAGGSGGGSSTSTPPSTPTIDQQGQTFSLGGSIDFVGRGFAHEESVTISLASSTVATAHADGGGNFSTGSLSLPLSMGSYTYMFKGSTGDHAQATITVH